MICSEVNTRMAAYNDLEEALLRTVVVAASSQKGILAPEDREMLLK